MRFVVQTGFLVRGVLEEIAHALPTSGPGASALQRMSFRTEAAMAVQTHRHTKNRRPRGRPICERPRHLQTVVRGFVAKRRLNT